MLQWYSAAQDISGINKSFSNKRIKNKVKRLKFLFTYTPNQLYGPI